MDDSIRSSGGKRTSYLAGLLDALSETPLAVSRTKMALRVRDTEGPSGEMSSVLSSASLSRSPFFQEGGLIPLTSAKCEHDASCTKGSASVLGNGVFT